jgi:hypothetical protein
MITFARAWDEFARVIEEARDLRQRDADANVVAELLRYARDLLDIIADEIIDEPSSTVANARTVLAELRNRLTLLEQDVMPTRH